MRARPLVLGEDWVECCIARGDRRLARRCRSCTRSTRAWPPEQRRRGLAHAAAAALRRRHRAPRRISRGARTRSSGDDGRQRRADLGGRALRRIPPALGPAGPRLRALRSRRRAHRSLDGRRRRRRVPGRDARDVGLPRHHARPRPPASEPGSARRVLASRRRSRARCSERRAGRSDDGRPRTSRT